MNNTHGSMTFIFLNVTQQMLGTEKKEHFILQQLSCTAHRAWGEHCQNQSSDPWLSLHKWSWTLFTDRLLRTLSMRQALLTLAPEQQWATAQRKSWGADKEGCAGFSSDHLLEKSSECTCSSLQYQSFTSVTVQLTLNWYSVKHSIL